MARRRLTRTDPQGSDSVPRAEHLSPAGLETKAFTRLNPSAPIARVAADAVGAAALEEISDTLRRARETGRMILDLPLAAISPDHLVRDRIPAEDEEMQALRESLRAHGQRTPIEVTPLAGTGPGALPYGLISGWRRLSALAALHAETGEARFATVQAILRTPDTVADAYVNMVEENEIRVGLSQYERARVAVMAAAPRRVRRYEEAALQALFGTASRPKRSRIRAFVEIVEALDGRLRFPAHLPERLGLRLVDRLRQKGGTAQVIQALEDHAPDSPEAELAVLEGLLRPLPAQAPGLEADPVKLARGVTLEQSLKGKTLTFRLKGPGVTPELRAAARRALLELGDRARNT